MQPYFKYFPRNSFVHKLDPRTKLFLLITYIFLAILFTDVRILMLILISAIIIYLAAKLPFKENIGTWKFLVFSMIFLMVILNLISPYGAKVENPHIIFKFWIFALSWEGIFLSLAAVLRFLSGAIISMVFIMSTDPSLFAPAAAGLKIPDKGAFVFDLALRWVPSYVDDLFKTINAQMARGYKIGSGKGIISKIIMAVPLVLPVTMKGILSVHDVSDAMELRGFGYKKCRTWYREVKMTKKDYFAILLMIITVILGYWLKINMFPSYWLPIS